MSIKALLDSVDDIPEALKPLYVEDNGKFVLDIEGIDDHPKVRGVITANRENVKKRDQYKRELADAMAKVSALPDDFDPEEYAALKASGGKPDEALQTLRDQHARAIERLTAKFNSDLAAKDGEVLERDSYIDRSVADAGLKTALLDVGVKPGLLDGALAALRPSVKVQRTDKGDRKAIVETDMGEMDVPSFVKDWAGSKGKEYLAPPTGPNPTGNNGRNGNGSKTITRKDWEGMTAPDRLAKAKDGFKVVDAA